MKKIQIKNAKINFLKVFQMIYFVFPPLVSEEGNASASKSIKKKLNTDLNHHFYLTETFPQVIKKDVFIFVNAQTVKK